MAQTFVSRPLRRLFSRPVSTAASIEGPYENGLRRVTLGSSETKFCVGSKSDTVSEVEYVQGIGKEHLPLEILLIN